MRILHLAVIASCILSLLGCKSTNQKSILRADGASWDLGNMPSATYTAIKSACEHPLGAADLGISKEECYLIIAGSAVRESSWNPDKSCEAWGNPGDPCCGLTQSRRMDAKAVGLTCNPHEFNANGYTCNVLTGLRNIGCKASNGQDCKQHGNDASLYTGVKKHLGYNTANLNSYVQDMKAIYNRSDIRAKFGIESNATRSWDAVFYGSAANRQQSQSQVQTKEQTKESGQEQSKQQEPDTRSNSTRQSQASKASDTVDTPIPSGSEQWVDPYSQAKFPYCASTSSDPDGDGWGWEQAKSCKVRGR